MDLGRAEAVEAVLADPFNAIGEFSDDPDSATHLDELELTDADDGAFKTPTLRNVADTAPYMHSGAYRSLWEVLEFYREGGGHSGIGELDPRMQPLDLSDDDLRDLLTWLETLTDRGLPQWLVTTPVLP